MAVFANDTLNRFSSIFDNKQDTYNLYYYFIPSLKWKRISYIKKKKKEEADALENLNLVAKNKNISTREILQYVELSKNLTK